MERRYYQVFVSSTYKDLVDEREQVTEQLLRSGCIPAGMELFTASGRPPWDVITSVIETTDYMILILGGRYGSAGHDGRSFTEREYDEAESRGIPVLAFLHQDIDNLPRRNVDVGEAAEKLASFREKVSDSERHTVQFWSDARDLAQKAGTAIGQAIMTEPRPGWVRGDSARVGERSRPDRGSDEHAASTLRDDSTSDDLRVARSAADRRVLVERLGDWTPQSSFFRWLTDEVNHKYFPHTRWDEIHNKDATWDSDARRLNDPDLDERFGDVSKALNLYHQRIISNLFTIDNKPGHEGYSSVPGEWAVNRPQLHRQAFVELDEGRQGLITALNGLYQAAHERGIELAPPN